MTESKRLTRRECARVLSYACGYLEGKGYRFEHPFLFTSLAAALFDASEQVTVVGWMLEQMRIAAIAADSFGAEDIATQLRRAADTLETTDTEELARLGIGGAAEVVAELEVAEWSKWQPIETAPEGVVVETRIDDQHGPRNETPLKRIKGLWWFPDGSMYVYYRPTHWKHQSLGIGGGK